MQSQYIPTKQTDRYWKWSNKTTKNCLKKTLNVEDLMFECKYDNIKIMALR